MVAGCAKFYNTLISYKFIRCSVQNINSTK